MKAGYTFERIECTNCGASVAENWYVRHRKSGCKVGCGRSLCPMERKVLRRLAMGGGNEAIAQDLDIAENTVKNYLYRTARKMGVYASRTGILMRALRRGEVALEELVAPAHVLGEEGRAR